MARVTVGTLRKLEEQPYASETRIEILKRAMDPMPSGRRFTTEDTEEAVIARSARQGGSPLCDLCVLCG